MLTKTEEKILQFLIHGQLNKEIADACCISELTVKKHLTNIYRKLKVRNRSEAIVYLKDDQLRPLPKTPAFSAEKQNS
jgi:DNA-binding NarL/FixJ family response regulator